MHSKVWGLGAAAVIALAACGGGSGADGGTKSGSPCSTDADCGGGYLCHPLAKLCVETCTTAADCLGSAKNCAAYAGPQDSGTLTDICQCTADADCGGGTGSTAICGLEDKICEVKCGSSADCKSARSCDTASGQCQSLVVGCNPTCGASQYCDTTTSPPSCVNNCTVGSCTASQVCDSTSGKCIAAPTCNMANNQPDTCVNGEFCSTTSACADVPPPTCPNFTSSAHANTWSPTNGSPTIYGMSVDSFMANTTICPTGQTQLAKIHVFAYWEGGKFPTGTDPTGGGSGGNIEYAMHYVRNDGSESTTLANLVSATALNVVNGSPVSEADFHMFFCLPDGTTSFTGGLHFWTQPNTDLSSCSGGAACTCTTNCVSGNEFCVSAP